MFSPDGTSIYVYGDDLDHLICYDLPTKPNWPLILGIPLGLGALIYGVGAVWRWRYKQRV